MIKFSVTQNGKPLAKSKYQWDNKTETFSTNEDDLVLDFTGIGNCTFKTGNGCTFYTGFGCTFITGYNCTFKTGFGCTFKTGHNCTFNTGLGCTFTTGLGCTFTTGDYCTFDTRNGCTFKTGHGCTFTTGDHCIFYTGYDCTFKTGSNCFAIRCDVPDVTEIPENMTIKFNNCKTAGYMVIAGYEPHTIMIDGKEIKISEQLFNELKKQLVG